MREARVKLDDERVKSLMMGHSVKIRLKVGDEIQILDLSLANPEKWAKLYVGDEMRSIFDAVDFLGRK